MKTLEQIKEEVAENRDYTSWEKLKDDYIYWDQGKFEKSIDEVAKRYAKEVAKRALKNASASLIKHYFIDNSDIAIDSKEIEKIINCENNIPAV